MGDARQRRAERVFRIKLVGVLLMIVGFWVLIGLEVYRRRKGSEHGEVGEGVNEGV
jgi:hypothetical protein